MIPQDARVCVYAPPNTAKTTLLAGLAVSIATGRDWFGHAVKRQGGVIYVASEDVNGFKVRLEAAKLQARLSPSAVAGVYTFTEGLSLLDPVSVSLFVEYVREAVRRDGIPLVCVVIDTLSGSMPGANENAIEAMGLAMSHAKQIMTDLGVTVILSHHTNAGGSRERGHTVVRGECDTMIALEPVDDVVKVENNKQRNGSWFPAFELRLTALGKSVVLRPAKDVVAPFGALSEHQRRALTVLRDTFTAEGPTKTEWLKASTATGMSESTFWRASKELLERNYVTPAGLHFRLMPNGRKALGE